MNALLTREGFKTTLVIMIVLVSCLARLPAGRTTSMVPGYDCSMSKPEYLLGSIVGIGVSLGGGWGGGTLSVKKPDGSLTTMDVPASTGSVFFGYFMAEPVLGEYRVEIWQTSPHQLMAYCHFDVVAEVSTETSAVTVVSEETTTMTAASEQTSAATGDQFEVSGSPIFNEVVQGESVAIDIRVASSGSNQNVELHVSHVSPDLPSSISYDLSPTSGTPPFTAIFSIATTNMAPVRSYEFTVTGSNGQETHSTTVALTVLENRSWWMIPIVIGIVAFVVIAVIAVRPSRSLRGPEHKPVLGIVMCPYCERSNPGRNRFCRNCGRPLSNKTLPY